MENYLRIPTSLGDDASRWVLLPAKPRTVYRVVLDVEGPIARHLHNPRAKTFDYAAWTEMQAHDPQAVAAFLNLRAGLWDIGRFEREYVGQWDSMEHYAAQLFADLADIPANLFKYVDYISYASDLEDQGFEFYDGHVFRPA